MAVNTQAPDPSEEVIPCPNASAGLKEHKVIKPKFEVKDAHPSGRQSYGRLMQVLRGVSLGIFFWVCVTGYVHQHIESRRLPF